MFCEKKETTSLVSQADIARYSKLMTVSSRKPMAAHACIHNARHDGRCSRF